MLAPHYNFFSICHETACVIAGALLVFVHIFHQVLNQLPILRSGITEDDVEVYLGKLEGKTLDEHYEAKEKELLLKKKEEKKAEKAAALALAAAPKKKKEKKTDEEQKESTTSEDVGDKELVTNVKEEGTKDDAVKKEERAPETNDSGGIELKATVGGAPNMTLNDTSPVIGPSSATLTTAPTTSTVLADSKTKRIAKKASTKESESKVPSDYNAPKLSLFDGPSFTW